eukprot:jgi/Ulvmu1/2284/UM013_0131.1
MFQDRENWATALLLQLLSDRRVDSVSTDQQLLNTKTTELGQLLLHLQCTPAHQRPSRAAALESSISRVVRDIAGIRIGAHAVHETPVSSPASADTHDVVAKQDMAVLASDARVSDELAQGSADNSECHGISDDRLRLSHKFSVQSEGLNTWVNEYFLKHEAAASRQVLQAAAEASSTGGGGWPLPAHIAFAGVAKPISTLRLAAFTGTRFFRSALFHPPRTPPDGAPYSHATQHTQHGALAASECEWGAAADIEVAEVAPATLGVLLRMLEGAAPGEVALRQAGEVLAAMDYCMAAPPMFPAVVAQLAPLVNELAPLEVVWLVARCFAHVPDDELQTSLGLLVDALPDTPAAARGGRPANQGTMWTPPSVHRGRDEHHSRRVAFNYAEPSQLAPMASGLDTDVAMDTRGLDDGEGSCERSRCEQPTRLGDACMTAAALAASQELSECVRGTKHTLLLLAVASMPRAPLWLRTGTLAAATLAGQL